MVWTLKVILYFKVDGEVLTDILAINYSILGHLSQDGQLLKRLGMHAPSLTLQSLQ